MKKKRIKENQNEKTAPRGAPEEHRKKTFWERFGLFLLSAAVSLLFAGAFVAAGLLGIGMT